MTCASENAPKRASVSGPVEVEFNEQYWPEQFRRLAALGIKPKPTKFVNYCPIDWGQECQCAWTFYSLYAKRFAPIAVISLAEYIFQVNDNFPMTDEQRVNWIVYLCEQLEKPKEGKFYKKIKILEKKNFRARMSKVLRSNNILKGFGLHPTQVK